MSSTTHRRTGAAAIASTAEELPPAKPPQPRAPPDPDEHPPAPYRGPIGNIAAASSTYVVSSVGGMFNKMSEYLEMKTITGSTFGESTDDEFYDSVETVSGGISPPPVNNVKVENNQRSRGGLLSGLGRYFGWPKYQTGPSQDNDNNNRNVRRNSSSVDGDLISNSSFHSLPDDDDVEHEHTSFCEPYPLIEEEILSAVSVNDNGEGVYVDDDQRGQGHKFVPTQLLNIITWCDKCGELIWGFYKQCLRCTYCKYTCHYKCINDVGLDCTESPELRKDVPDHSPQHTLVSIEDVENEAESFVFLTREELEPKIEKFNTLRKPKSEALTLGEEGTQFSGQVSVHINLSRPVSVRTGCPLPDICISTLKQYEHSIDTHKKRTTFFLPKATTQDVNLSCYTTAQDVIRNVLAKLQLIDNPRKFALFERTEHNGEVFMRKMVDEDKPLFWCLGWVSSTGNKRFELRENETGVIEWEAFTVPELQNFLRILDKEEEEYMQKVRSKYLKYQSLLEEAYQAVQEKEAQVKVQQLEREQGGPIKQDQGGHMGVAITA